MCNDVEWVDDSQPGHDVVIQIDPIKVHAGGSPLVIDFPLIRQRVACSQHDGTITVHVVVTIKDDYIKLSPGLNEETMQGMSPN